MGPVDGAGETGYPLGLAWRGVLCSGAFMSRAPVAQWIEYCPPKAGVAGSIPAGRTISSTASSGLWSSPFLLGVAKVHLLFRHPVIRVASRSVGAGMCITFEAGVCGGPTAPDRRPTGTRSAVRQLHRFHPPSPFNASIGLRRCATYRGGLASSVPPPQLVVRTKKPCSFVLL
jgi:hypothetical protein